MLLLLSIGRYVFNVMHIKYSYMRADVNKSQLATEAASAAIVARLDQEVLDYIARSNHGGGGGDVRNVQLPAATVANLTAAYTANAKAVVAHWWTLPDTLIALYADGFYNDSYAVSLPYTDNWLRESGFEDGPGDTPCPPCPCFPKTSPQCSACCGKDASGGGGGVGQSISGGGAGSCNDLRGCVRGCDAQGHGYRQCVRECDETCE